MMDINALPPFIDPPAIVQEVRKRSNGRRNDKTTRRRNTALFIGAVVVLTDANGTSYECRVTHQTPDGQWWCDPL